MTDSDAEEEDNAGGEDDLDENGRPPPRSTLVAFLANKKDVERFKRRAKAGKRNPLDVLRSWLHGYGINETSEPPVLPAEGKRATKRSKKSPKDPRKK